MVLHTLTGANEGTDMGKTPEKKSSGKKAPFGTTKGAFGKEGKGVRVEEVDHWVKW